MSIYLNLISKNSKHLQSRCGHSEHFKSLDKHFAYDIMCI